jgi:Mechanosensitive ion channel, conserved TM helix
MTDFFDKVVTQPLRDVFQKLVAFLPNLLTGIIVFAIGLVVALLVKILVVRIVRLLKLEAAFTRSGLTDALQRMAVKDTPDKLIGRMFFWLVTVLFFVLALSAMKVPVIDQLLERFLLYLPNVLVALIIMTLGYFLGNFLGRAVLIASVNAGVRLSGLLSKGVKTVIMLFAFAMALEQLGIGRSTVIAAFTIVFGGAVLALALAFGLGGQDLARRLLEKRLKKDGDGGRDDLKHL